MPPHCSALHHIFKRTDRNIVREAVRQWRPIAVDASEEYHVYCCRFTTASLGGVDGGLNSNELS